MIDTVTITFTADIGELQRGLQQAASGIADATATMKTGAQQVALSFADITRSYAAGVTQRLDLLKAGSVQELAIARSGDQAETAIALDAIKLKQNQVKEEAQLSQISHEAERAQLLALEADRQTIEQRHLAFLQSTYKDNATAFANVQRQIDELSAQSALRRQQIEQTYLKQVYADYRSTFEGIASSMSQQVTGLISGQQTLRQAVANVLLSIIQQFVAARLKIVADWAAGVAAETAATTAGEATKTSAVVAGTAARTSAQEAGLATSAITTVLAIGKSIIASAAQTFAGIFGFLAPVMGPAAAGPAVAGQATVLAAGAALPSFDAGAWNLPGDMIAQVHQGEMIVPAAAAARMRDAATGGGGSPVNVHHQTSFNVAAMDSQDVRRFLSANSRAILAAINDGVRYGSHLGLSKLGRV